MAILQRGNRKLLAVSTGSLYSVSRTHARNGRLWKACMAFVRKASTSLVKAHGSVYKLPWCIIHFFFFFLLFNYKISVSIKKYFLNCLNIIGLDFFQTFKYLVYKRDYDFYLIFKYNSYKILLIYHYPINIYFYNKR